MTFETFKIWLKQALKDNSGQKRFLSLGTGSIILDVELQLILKKD